VLLFSGGIFSACPRCTSSARGTGSGGGRGIDLSSGSAPSYANLDYIVRFLDEVVKIWRDIPEIVSSWQIASRTTTLAALTIWCPGKSANAAQQAVQAELQAKLAGIAGWRCSASATPRCPGPTRDCR
jgi:hypothetical protein